MDRWSPVKTGRLTVHSTIQKLSRVYVVFFLMVGNSISVANINSRYEYLVFLFLQR